MHGCLDNLCFLQEWEWSPGPHGRHPVEDHPGVLRAWRGPHQQAAAPGAAPQGILLPRHNQPLQKCSGVTSLFGCFYVDLTILQVSKPWNVLALDGSNWQKVDLFEFQVDIEGTVVENLAKRCGGFLKSLSLKGCQVQHNCRKEHFVELNQAVLTLSFMTLVCRMLATPPSAASPPTAAT